MKKIITASLISLMLLFISSTVLALETARIDSVKIAAGSPHDNMGLDSPSSNTEPGASQNKPDAHNNQANSNPHGSQPADQDAHEEDTTPAPNPATPHNSSPHGSNEYDNDSRPSRIVIGGFAGVIALIIITAAVLKKKSVGVEQ